MMQTRPSTVYVRKKCVKRKSLRNALEFAVILMLLLCLNVDLFASLILAGAAVIITQLVLLK